MASNTRKFRPLMVMGTSSGAGKSLIVSALCRIYSDMGIKVAPFKVQNMSLNAGVGKGGEMAYAQILQAKAARVEPNVDMNPILLKPEGDKTHIILQGKYYGTYESGTYFTEKNDYFLQKAYESFRKLSEEYELIIIEGAGSPAEINLKNDIANIKFSKLVNAANIIVADIERGGMFASVVGTLELTRMTNLIGIIVNKFRGNPNLLKEGYEYIERKYNTRFLGTVPFIENDIPEEDSMFYDVKRDGDINVAVIRTPFMANETDYQIFKVIKEVGIRYARKPEELEKADIIILPGSKMTVLDLNFIKNSGFMDKINELKNERWIIGICGGYQMMGKYVYDTVETGTGMNDAMNLLDAKTEISGDKITRINKATLLHPLFKGINVSGYEIHRGTTISEPHFSLINEIDGVSAQILDGSYKGKIIGTYIHGLFDNLVFTEKLLNEIAAQKGIPPLILKNIDQDYGIQKFADKVKENIDYAYILDSLR